MAQGLPPEIVRLLFKTLLNHAQGGTYVNALTVSHQWYDIGLPVLWRDIVLTELKLSRLCSGLAARPLRLYELVRSLRIRLSPHRRNGNDPYVDYNHESRQLARCLQCMPNLHTLSLDFKLANNNSVSRECSHHDLWAWGLNNILDNMPAGTINLEVIATGHLASSKWAPCLHCPNLARALSGAHNLRYDGALCPIFFRTFSEGTSSALEVVTINMISGTGCNKYDWRCSFQQWRGFDNAAELAQAARDVVESGALPRIRKLDIFSMLGDCTWSHEMSTSRKELGIVHRDIIQQKSCIYPVILGRPYCFIRYQQSPKHPHFDKAARLDDIALQLESGRWLETKFGSRDPAEFRHTQAASSGDYEWRPSPNILTVENVCLRWDPAATLWKWEQMSGRKLLLPRFEDHIGELKPLEREVCKEERNGVRLSDCVMVLEYPEHSGAENTDDSYVTEGSLGATSQLQ